LSVSDAERLRNEVEHFVSTKYGTDVNVLHLVAGPLPVTRFVPRIVSAMTLTLVVEDPAELRIFGQGGLAEHFAAEHPGTLEAVTNFVSAIADHGAIAFLLGPIVLARARPREPPEYSDQRD
jgi:hypothetical protein